MRSDVAVKVFGDDMAVLNQTAAKIAATLQTVAGASEVKVEQTTGLPVLTINIDRDKAARYGLNVAEVQEAIAIAVGGASGRHPLRGRSSVRYRREIVRGAANGTLQDFPVC